MRWKGAASTLLVLGVTASPASALAQCAMCGTSLQDGGDPLTRGVLFSTLFLISLPYLIVGSFAAALYWRSRRARMERAAAETPGLRLVQGGMVPAAKEEGH